MLKLNNIFQDKAVFQRCKAIPVFGKADANSKIKAEFAGQTVFTNSNSEGSFKMRFKSLEAGGPYTLKVYVCKTGESVTVNDILVGDVWLASGQSNMAYLLRPVPVAYNATNTPGLNRMQQEEFQKTIENSEKFRFITVKSRASCIEENDFEGKWQYMTSENAPECSAVAAWFGKYIQQKLDIPVGLIISSYGGTIAESWTSRAGLLANTETMHLPEIVDNVGTDEEIWDITADKIAKEAIPAEYADTGNEGFGNGYAEVDFNDSSWKDMKIPGSWIIQKIAGNGAVWTRKEVVIPDDWQGKELVLELGGIDKQDVTYFNGVEIGRTGKELETEWYDKKRHYEIPASLVRRDKNVIAVRAYSFLYDGSFNGKVEDFNLCLKNSDKKINISGAWKAFAEKDMGIRVGNALRLGPFNFNTPSILFNAMIKPILPYAIKGVIWYQGESNAKTVDDSAKYLKKLEIMIRDWYYNFEQGEFPFIQVQLAYYNRGLEDLCNPSSAWALLRDNQRLLCEKMDKVYMASAIDIGDHFDIHPQDKKTVGYRLAQNALHNVYYFNDIVPEGPLFKGYFIENNKIRLLFDNAEGMYIKEDLPQSFYVADADRNYYPADKVVIDGSSIIVSSNKVEYPKAARYAWADDPISTLYNSAGLPASSFQTDK